MPTSIWHGFHRLLTKRGIDCIDKYPIWPQRELACTSFAVWAKNIPSMFCVVSLLWWKNHVSLKEVWVINASIFYQNKQTIVEDGTFRSKHGNIIIKDGSDLLISQYQECIWDNYIPYLRDPVYFYLTQSTDITTKEALELCRFFLVQLNKIRMQ